MEKFFNKAKNADTAEAEKKYCSTCRHYAEFEGVCCNGESEWRADFRCLDDTCERWEEKMK